MSSLERLLLKVGAVLLAVMAGSFGIVQWAKAGDERLWTEV